MLKNRNIESHLFPNNYLNLIFTEIIFLIFISAFLLKYKYFKHHIISLIFFLIINVICFFVQNNPTILKANHLKQLAISISHVAFDAGYNCYQKYLMEKFYYPYWNIALIPGILQLIIGVSGLIFQLLFSNKEFCSYFKDHWKVLITFKIILPFIFHIIMCPLFILILYYFKPDFILIIFQLAAITKRIMDNFGNWKLYVCLLFGIMQILVLMFYLEILELNFCGLNENTQRNIDLRGQDDFVLEGRDSSVSLKGIDINKEYFIECQDKIENEVEMKEKNEEEDEKLGEVVK
jgi:hypothetical protein